MKVYTIKKTRKGHETIIENTLPELIKYFKYTFEVGKSWNNKINDNPKTITSFVSNLQKSFEELEASCFERTSIEFIK